MPLPAITLVALTLTHSCQFITFPEENIFTIFLYFVITGLWQPSLPLLFCKQNIIVKKIQKKLKGDADLRLNVLASHGGTCTKIAFHWHVFISLLHPAAALWCPMASTIFAYCEFVCSPRHPAAPESVLRSGRRWRCRSRRRRLSVGSLSLPFDLGWNGRPLAFARRVSALGCSTAINDDSIASHHIAEVNLLRAAPGLQRSTMPLPATTQVVLLPCLRGGRMQ